MALKIKEYLPGAKRRRKLTEARDSIQRSPAVVTQRISRYLGDLLEPGIDCPLRLDGEEHIISHRAGKNHDYLRIYRLDEVDTGKTSDHVIVDVCALPLRTGSSQPDMPSRDFILKYGSVILDQVQSFVDSEQYRIQVKERDEKLAEERELQKFELDAKNRRRQLMDQTRHTQAAELAVKLDQVLGTAENS